VLFLQARQEQVHVVMQPLIGMRGFLLAMRTLALMDFGTGHSVLPCVRG
jgi:hypothetical protein